jgi:hypothetical protein
MAADDEDGAALVEEAEVEREAHAEGVDAGAAGDEETLSRLIPIQAGKAEESGADACGHSNLIAEDRGDGQVAKARREACGHARSRLGTADLSPAASFDISMGKVAAWIAIELGASSGVQTLFQARPRRGMGLR